MYDLNDIFPNEYGFTKFVGLSTGEYRFCHMDGEHRMLVRDGETATSAGFLDYDSNPDTGERWFSIVRGMEGDSRTLKLGPADDDGPKIATLLNVIYKQKDMYQ